MRGLCLFCLVWAAPIYQHIASAGSKYDALATLDSHFDEVAFIDGDAEPAAGRAILLDHEGEAICSISLDRERTPFDLAATDSVIYCTESDLLALAMAADPLEEGQVAVIPLVPVAIGAFTVVAGCYLGVVIAEAAITFAENSTHPDSDSDRAAQTIVGVQAVAIGAGLGMQGDVLSVGHAETVTIRRVVQRVVQSTPGYEAQTARIERWLKRGQGRILRSPFVNRFRMTITGAVSSGVCYGARYFLQ